MVEVSEEIVKLPAQALEDMGLGVDPAAMDRVMSQLNDEPMKAAIDKQAVIDKALDESPNGLVDKDGEELPPHYSDDWDIKLYPDPILKNTERMEDVTVFDEDLERCAARLLAVMYKYGGVGLAAPQVGWNKRVIVVDVAPGRGAPTVLCNPVITESSKKKDSGIEGCLSFPTIRFKVSRSATVKITAHTMDGEAAELEISGLLAKVVQHEVDHLNGKLFTAYASPVGQATIKGKLKQLKRFRERQKEQEAEKRGLPLRITEAAAAAASVQSDCTEQAGT